MDIFGPVWENHTERLRENWNKTVAPDDTVVVPGDISWAMHFEEARADFRFIESLNGKKILLKGNHDYWWQTNAKNRNFLESEGLRTITILFNDAVRAEDFIVCGTRGWFVDSAYSPEDDKIVEREAGRYRLSFQAAEKLQKQYGGEILAFLHYPLCYGGVTWRKAGGGRGRKRRPPLLLRAFARRFARAAAFFLQGRADRAGRGRLRSVHAGAHFSVKKRLTNRKGCVILYQTVEEE